MGGLRRGIVAAAAVAGLVAVGLVVSPASVVAGTRGLLASPWFPLVLVGLYLVRPFLAWPIVAISLLVGLRYGVGWGVPIALLGAVGTSLLPYAVARRFRSTAGWAGRATHGSERFFGAVGPVRGVAAARLAPTPAEAVSGAAGVARVPLRAFVLGTAVGELPWTVAAVVAGASLRGPVVAGPVIDARLVLAGLLAAGLILAGPAYRLLRRRRAAGR